MRARRGSLTEPGERGQTARQALRLALRGPPRTARELSGELSLTEHEVVAHLEHLQRSLQREHERLVVVPPTCAECGFVFRKRERLGRPTRCPECRGSRIAAARFSIEPAARG